MPKVSNKVGNAGSSGRRDLPNRRIKQDDAAEESNAPGVDTVDQIKDAEDLVVFSPPPPFKHENEAGSGGISEEEECEAEDSADSSQEEEDKAEGIADGEAIKNDEDSMDIEEDAAKSAPDSLANDFVGGQESWNAMLYQLLLYKAIRGDLNVPINDTSHRLLYNWILTQRKHYKLYQENKTSSTFLNADRIAVLDAIDFQWNIRGESFWQKHFESLTTYKAEHGDVRVPRLYAKNPKLGEWVTDQRRQWKFKMEGKSNQMSDERKTKLDEIGFVWKVRDRADWNDRYEQLLEFKKESGHCIVPQHFVRNRSLGKWVAKQREQYRFYREGKHSFLTEERIDLLKSVEFVWQIKGRGVKKGKLVKTNLVKEAKDKSLVQVEAEENVEKDSVTITEEVKLKPPSLLHGALGMDSANVSGDHHLPSLPALTHQSLLPANMAAIAAHASVNHGNQNIVADLAAAFRFGGVNPNQVPLGDPRAVAALRAAQLGSDPNNPRSFSSMI